MLPQERVVAEELVQRLRRRWQNDVIKHVPTERDIFSYSVYESSQTQGTHVKKKTTALESLVFKQLGSHTLYMYMYMDIHVHQHAHVMSEPCIPRRCL